MDTEIYLSVIIPAYNEEKLIESTLIEISDFLSRQDYNYEIIVVDDGSCDNTVTILENLKSIIKNLIVLRNEKNYGKGYSVSKGMLFANGKYRLFMDADNSTRINQIKNFLPFLASGYDVAIGNRRLKESNIKERQSLYKEMLGNFGNALIRLFVVPKIKDTQCGFKLFSKEASSKIFSSLIVYRWGFDIETLVIADKLGYKIKTIPVIWENREETRVRLKDYFLTFRELLKIKINLLRKKYDNSK